MWTCVRVCICVCVREIGDRVSLCLCVRAKESKGYGADGYAPFGAGDFVRVYVYVCVCMCV